MAKAKRNPLISDHAARRLGESEPPIALLTDLWALHLLPYAQEQWGDSLTPNEWQVVHMADPRSVVPESVMPPYGFLADRLVKQEDIAAHLKANRAVGVPYSDEMIEAARADLVAQADPEADHEALLGRYPKAEVGDLDGDPGRLTEMDAMVAYLQILGRMVDFTEYETEDLLQ